MTLRQHDSEITRLIDPVRERSSRCLAVDFPFWEPPGPAAPLLCETPASRRSSKTKAETREEASSSTKEPG